jgi:hypothetical protein
MESVMSKIRLIAMTGGTLACALGIGFFMQMGDSAPKPQPVPAASKAQTNNGSVHVAFEPRLALEDVTLTYASTDPVEPQPPVALAMVDASQGVSPQTPPDPAVPALPNCDVIATATTNAGAMVDLKIEAACFKNERVTIHHNGMMFTEVTDENGLLSVQAPALSEMAIFIVEMANGKGAVAQTEVPSLVFYDRVALQWADKSGFQIHAREFGANYGDAGHAWSGAARDVTAAAMGDAGFMTQLGDPDTLTPRMAEVYTFPTGSASVSGVVALTVEAEVTDFNCGREIEAQSLELRGASGLRTRDLVLAVPSCGAIGDFLVLNNLMDDLKIAAK